MCQGGIIGGNAKKGGGIEGFAEAKVSQTKVAIAADQKIVGFDVAVDVTVAVNNFEREQEGCSVELGGVVREDVLTLGCS